MATIMRKMNIISRCEAQYRTDKTGSSLQGIFHSYVLAVCHRPGLSQDALAKHLCINKSSVTRHLSCLEKDGYIERRHSEEDKREMLVYPTAKMMNIHSEVVSITKEWNSLIADGISEEELAVFNGVLDRMLERSIELTYSKEGAK